ncbi:hypothetical protein PRIEUP_LOCUS1779, partial [Pristimantis euphronides]
MTTEDPLNNIDKDTSMSSTCSEADNTSERLPLIIVNVNPSEYHTEEIVSIEEHLVSSLEKAMSNGTIRPMPSVSSDNGNIRVVEQTLHVSNNVKLPPLQLPSSNSEENVTPEQINCTDMNNFIKPDTSVGCALFHVQPAKDLGAQGNSEMDLSGYPSVTEPGVTLCSPCTFEGDANETEVCASVGDSTLEKMESDFSASQCYSGEVPSPSSSTTLQNEKEELNKEIISQFVSPQQITAISKKLGPLSARLKSIVPQIRSAIESPRSNTNEDTGQNGDEEDLVCWNNRESISRKRKRFEEPLPDTRLQQTEGDLSEELKIPEEQDEHEIREESLLAEMATPERVESEIAPEHQSGPSRITRRYRRRLFGSVRRNKCKSCFHYNRAGALDHITGFGLAVAGQCRRIPQDRQAKYMAFVLATVDLFCAPATLPEIDTLVTNFRTLLASSQPSA